MACSAHSDTNVFVQMKRGGTLEAEWIIFYAELVSEVTLTFFMYTLGTRKVLSPFSMLVIRTWPEQLGGL